MSKNIPLAYSICEEFSETVLLDKKRNSILINVHEDYFPRLYRELIKCKYKLVFKTRISSTSSLTCIFILE